MANFSDVFDNFRTPGRSDARTSRHSNARTSRRSDARTLGRPGTRTFGRPDTRTLGRLCSSFLNFCGRRGRKNCAKFYERNWFMKSEAQCNSEGPKVVGTQRSYHNDMISWDHDILVSKKFKKNVSAQNALIIPLKIHDFSPWEF